MEDTLLEFENGIADILELFNRFRDSIGENPVSKGTKNHIEKFIKDFENYKVVLEKGSIEEVAEAALSVCSNSTMIGFFIDDVDKQTKSYSEELSSRAAEVRKNICFCKRIGDCSYCIVIFGITFSKKEDAFISCTRAKML